MALRRSRRLQQLQPEETNLGVCSICQDDFSVDVLHRLRRADCCEALFHRCCFNQMLAHTSRCPACRHENEPENPRALELPMMTWKKQSYSCWCLTILKVLLRPYVSRRKSRKKFVIIDFAGYPYRTDQTRRFGTFCLTLSLNIIFFVFVCH